jgi:hypothetical protein
MSWMCQAKVTEIRREWGVVQMLAVVSLTSLVMLSGRTKNTGLSFVEGAQYGKSLSGFG